MPSDVVSVVLVSHSGTDEKTLCNCLESISSQTFPDDKYHVELVVDDAPELATSVRESFSDSLVTVHDRPEDRGLVDARNHGASQATGEFVVFVDADTTPSPRWLDSIVDGFQTYNADGIAGAADPNWPLESRPAYFPSEMDWLVGVTSDVPPMQSDDGNPTPVRNGFGCNFAVRNTVLETIGGFHPQLGKSGNLIQGEDVELCLRVHENATAEEPFWFLPAARVTHQVDEGQVDTHYLFRRAFWQGYTKSVIGKMHTTPRKNSSEFAFLRHLLTVSPRKYLSSPSPESVAKLLMLYALTFAVGLGFVYGSLVEPS